MVQEYPILSTMSLKKALEILGKGPCYHMQEIWGKPDMKETLSKWSEAGELSDIEAGEVRFRQCLVSFNKKVDFSVVSKIKPHKLFQSGVTDTSRSWLQQQRRFPKLAISFSVSTCSIFYD